MFHSFSMYLGLISYEWRENVGNNISASLILPRPLSSSRCCPACWDSWSCPPSAQPCCYETPPNTSPLKKRAPRLTPTPSAGLNQARSSLLRKCPGGRPTLAAGPCRCPLQESNGHPLGTWLTAPTCCGCLEPPTHRCLRRPTWQFVTCCSTRRFLRPSTRFPFSASALTAKELWGPKETVETGALQACRLL